jgi:RNA polymerase sigma-70 factor (ECF subfamily)
MDSLLILELVKQKKEKGISLLYDKYAPALNGIIVRIVKSEAQAEEVLQQAFLHIIQTIDQYDEQKSSLFTWMSHIAREQAKLISQSSREQVHEKTVALPEETHLLLLGIESEYKEVLDHIYLLGYTPEETSTKLNIPVTIVQSRLRRAIDQLRNNIHQDPRLFVSKVLSLSFVLAILS